MGYKNKRGGEVSKGKPNIHGVENLLKPTAFETNDDYQWPLRSGNKKGTGWTFRGHKGLHCFPQAGGEVKEVRPGRVGQGEQNNPMSLGLTNFIL